ncbi:hypothetical protein GCM10007860_19230 [Chitiniphilus shinanonensis]|uniref:DUF1653 domain-containing protein n=1 Tax=Chitiniphilus shinanonensis TaxID=553088 RepID=A0ABQ6BUC4_9NEIS|nr:DUF1653 domain-containing protein [Chitiniphilus shinanonensis]GLS04775.1 hypothetical protein GCM10007860_19230 [Chitiniphilus shinanonensis]
MTDRPDFQLGRYRHYKGNDYDAIDLVRHSETCEWLVLYRALYGDFGLWVRPLAMFVETVVIDGEPRPRFARIEPNQAADASTH